MKVFHGFVQSFSGHVRTVVLQVEDSVSPEEAVTLLREKMLPILGVEGTDWEGCQFQELKSEMSSLLVWQTTETFKAGK